MLLIRFQLFFASFTSSTTTALCPRRGGQRRQLPDGRFRICRRVVCALQRERKDDRSPCALYPTDSSCVSSSSPASINARVHYVANGLGLVERAET